MHRDFESALIRNAIGSMKGDRSVCSHCRRTPLIGERLHRLESGRLVCDLCLAALPPERRATVSSELVRATARPITVAHPGV